MAQGMRTGITGTFRGVRAAVDMQTTPLMCAGLTSGSILGMSYPTNDIMGHQPHTTLVTPVTGAVMPIAFAQYTSSGGELSRSCRLFLSASSAS
jgi:hypothetical protein